MDLNTCNHDYVDLGLSVKWATCNVGAKRPEDCGDYFAWGEIETKDYYTEDTYRWGYEKDAPIKYNTNGHIGPIDNKITLDFEDDAAHVKWGGNWRMPIKEELEELLSNCNWKWSIRNGIAGLAVTSKVVGFQNQTLFMPASGCRENNSSYSMGKCGFYWSKNVDPFLAKQAYSFNFYSYKGADNAYLEHIPRWYGFPIRPVCE